LKASVFSEYSTLIRDTCTGCARTMNDRIIVFNIFLG
jgi:hypothetical protein